MKKNKKIISTNLNKNRNKKNIDTSNNTVFVKGGKENQGKNHTVHLNNRLISDAHINDKLVMYRNKIDYIDSKISKLLADRYKLVKDIGKYKINNNIPITNSKREKQVINNVIKKYEDNSIKKYISNIFISIINYSKAIEN